MRQYYHITSLPYHPQDKKGLTLLCLFTTLLQLLRVQGLGRAETGRESGKSEAHYCPLFYEAKPVSHRPQGRVTDQTEWT